MHQVPSLRDGDDASHVLFFCIYLVPFVGSTLYSFCWDIFMDWNLYSAKRRCLCIPCGRFHLRKQRLYGERWIYHLAMVADFFLRFFGTMTFVPKATNLLPTVSGEKNVLHSLGTVAPFLEVCRRGLWSIFKLETMELNDIAQCESQSKPQVPDALKNEPVTQTVFSQYRTLVIEIVAVVLLIVGIGLAITLTGKTQT
jgi:hypothetical protein